MKANWKGFLTDDLMVHLKECQRAYLKVSQKAGQMELEKADQKVIQKAGEKEPEKADPKAVPKAAQMAT